MDGWAGRLLLVTSAVSDRFDGAGILMYLAGQMPRLPCRDLRFGARVMHEGAN